MTFIFRAYENVGCKETNILLELTEMEDFEKGTSVNRA